MNAATAEVLKRKVPPGERCADMLQQGYVFHFLEHHGNIHYLTDRFLEMLPGLRECLDNETAELQRRTERFAPDPDHVEELEFCLELMDEAARDDAPECVRRIRRFADEISAWHPITGEGFVGLCAIYVYNKRYAVLVERERRHAVEED